jgi:hypothetical protein
LVGIEPTLLVRSCVWSRLGALPGVEPGLRVSTPHCSRKGASWEAGNNCVSFTGW